MLAPGGDKVSPIQTTTLDSNYVSTQGTSFAAPHVSGVISLMKSVYPNLNWKSARKFLTESMTPLTCDQYCGNNKDPALCKSTCCTASGESACPGLIDAEKAVRRADFCQKLKGGECVSRHGKSIIKAPLIDADQYAIFTDVLPYQKEIVVKNLGADPARVFGKSSMPNIKIISLGTRGNYADIRGGESARFLMVVDGRKNPPFQGVVTFSSYGLQDGKLDTKAIDQITTTVMYEGN